MSLVQLPSATIKLITSTQIITSVSSAVKELVENSLDAGATNIDVKLENNGLDIIEVKDDGCGIRRTDTANMALPSYTSKLCDYADLNNLHSYGFRGEALNALCLVADVSITTRTRDDDYAMTYTLNNNGCIIDSKPSHLGKGTLVTVKGLFRNLPVRKQYLSSGRRAAEELKRADSVVKSLAVIHPSLRVTFCHNKCLLWQKSACSNLRQSLMQVVTHYVTNKLEELTHDEPGLNIVMLVPKRDADSLATLSQSSSECMMNYINSRPVRYKKLEKMVLKYISEYFPGQLPLHKYPHYLLSIMLSPGETDVNLEPNKTRVLLKEENEVLLKVEALLAAYYQAQEPSSETDKTTPDTSETTAGGEAGACKRRRMDEDIPTPAVAQNTRVEISALGRQVLLNGSDQPSVCDESLASVEKHSPCSERKYDERLTTNASVVANDGWTIVKNGCVENTEVPVMENRGFQNAETGVSNGLSRVGSTGSCSSSYFSQSKHRTNNIDDVLMLETSNIFNFNEHEVQNEDKFESDSEKFQNKNLEVISEGTEGINGDKEELHQEIKVLGKESGFGFVDESPVVLNEAMNVDALGLDSDVGRTVPQSEEGSCSAGDKNTENLADLFEMTDKAMENWSMGMLKSKNGKLLQGSTVMLPSRTIDSFNQSVSSQMGHKELSAFTKFSREERPKILKEFPSIVFTRVAEVLAERWAALSNEERLRYEKLAKEVDEKRKSSKLDTGIQRLDTFLSAPRSKTKSASPKKTSPPKKEARVEEARKEVKVEKKAWKRPKRKKEKFEISFNSLKEEYLDTSRKNLSDPSKMILVAELKPSGEWLYRQSKELGVVRHWALQEMVLYHRLLRDHAVPLKKLDSKIPVDESCLGRELLNTLLSLNREYDVVAHAVVITSSVIVKNGFKIEVQEGRSCCLLTEVASTINFYGVNDLKETLRLVRAHGSSSLEKTRSLRVITYIKDEAVRIVRQCSARMEKDTLQDLIKYWQTNLAHMGTCCLHRKPIFHLLRDLSKAGE